VDLLPGISHGPSTDGDRSSTGPSHHPVQLSHVVSPEWKSIHPRHRSLPLDAPLRSILLPPRVHPCCDHSGCDSPLQNHSLTTSASLGPPRHWTSPKEKKKKWEKESLNVPTTRILNAFDITPEPLDESLPSPLHDHITTTTPTTTTTTTTTTVSCQYQSILPSIFPYFRRPCINTKGLHLMYRPHPSHFRPPTARHEVNVHRAGNLMHLISSARPLQPLTSKSPPPGCQMEEGRERARASFHTPPSRYCL
jgi:hypothetical protein